MLPTEDLGLATSRPRSKLKMPCWIVWRGHDQKSKYFVNLFQRGISKLLGVVGPIGGYWHRLRPVSMGKGYVCVRFNTVV